MKRVMTLIFAAATLTPLASAQAQSLSVLASQEAERRSQIGRPGRVFTNADLPAPKETAPESATLKSPMATDSVTGLATTAAAAAPHFDDRGEDYWRGRLAAVRRRVTQARADVDALSARAGTLGEQPRADRGEVELTAATLRAADADFRALERDSIAFEREARAAKVPADWLR